MGFFKYLVRNVFMYFGSLVIVILALNCFINLEQITNPIMVYILAALVATLVNITTKED